MNSYLTALVCECNKCRIASIIVIENNITGKESSLRVTKFVQVLPPSECSDNYCSSLGYINAVSWQHVCLSHKLPGNKNPRKPSPCAVLRYPWLIVSTNRWKWAESNNKIIAIEFASRYCVNCGNNAKTRSNLKMDTRLVRIPILAIGSTISHSHPINIACNTSSVWLRNHKNSIIWPEADYTHQGRFRWLTLKDEFWKKIRSQPQRPVVHEDVLTSPSYQAWRYGNESTVRSVYSFLVNYKQYW